MRNYKKDKFHFGRIFSGSLGIFLSMLCLVIFQTTGFAQTKTVEGTVTADSGESLPGVSIVIKGTTQGTITDVDGNFQLTLGEDNVLVFSFIGFELQEVPAAGQTTINVVMQQETKSIEEVVVTGYSTQSKATVTTSIITVDAEPLQNIPAGGNAVNALIGKVSGVTVIQSDGRSGSAPGIQIRGGTTPGFGGDTPLYIVDGFVQTDIGAIDMNDVEEFTILKDAAATAIYGAEAANGVIIVKTRHGKKGKFNVQFKYAREHQSIERYKLDVLPPEEEVYYARMSFLNYEDPLGYQFISGRSQWWSAVQPYHSDQPGYVENNASLLHWADDVLQYNGGVLPDGYHQTVDPVTGRQLAFQVHDWQDATFTDGSADSYFLNIGGGTDKATYSVSMSYYDVKGIGVFNDYKRYYLNANTEIQLSDKVKSGISFNYGIEDENRGEGNQWYQRSGFQSVTTRLWNEDGTPAPNFKNSGKYNPEYYENNLMRERINTDVKLSAFLEWEIIDGLKFKPSIKLRQDGSSYASIIYENQINGSKRNQQGWQTAGLSTQFDALLTYRKTFKDVHNLSALAGTSFRNGYAYAVNGTAFGASTDLIPVIISSLPNENTVISTSYSKTAIQSWFGQVSYDYQKRYLLNATLRYDGHYKFTDDNKWGLFPGISAGWNLHEEGFWGGLGIGWLKKAKLKASYGEAGKSAGLSINDTQGAYSTVSYANLGGVLQSNLQNTSLVWETTREWVAGLDMTFFEGNKMDASIQYYDKSAIDRLFSEPIPSFTGFSGIRTNIGSFASKGLEFQIDANIINTSKISWNVNAFFDYMTDQKTVKLPFNGAENNRISGTNITNPNDPTGDPILVGGYAEGERWGGIYGYVVEKLLQNWDEADEYNNRVYDEVSG
ncbi:MAG: SusC/RagA family TonB-linked outer membrane protein, partial [Bacteroidetes bacterium]|nr:SusC/RagA family TonB-linked outer membrane protein [Bacteroidota bacterium]